VADTVKEDPPAKQVRAFLVPASEKWKRIYDALIMQTLGSAQNITFMNDVGWHAALPAPVATSAPEALASARSLCRATFPQERSTRSPRQSCTLA
jgi:hypothetical protein